MNRTVFVSDEPIYRPDAEVVEWLSEQKRIRDSEESIKAKWIAALMKIEKVEHVACIDDKHFSQSTEKLYNDTFDIFELTMTGEEEKLWEEIRTSLYEDILFAVEDRYLEIRYGLPKGTEIKKTMMRTKPMESMQI